METPFYNLSNIQTFTFGDEVERIPTYLCSSMSGLTSISIPNSVTSIGSNAFYDCGSLESISVANGNCTYDSRGGCNAIIETANNTLIKGCKNTIIPMSVTSIGDYAFEYCGGLTSVIIPNSVTSIGGYAFQYCRGLKNIYSFIEKPSKVKLGNSVFNYISKSTCYLNVPSGSVSLYKKAAQWKDFEHIVPIVEGDVNGDDLVSGSDVTALYNLLLDGGEVDGNADVNGDGIVNGADVTALYTLLLEK